MKNISCVFSVIFDIKIWTSSKKPVDYLKGKYGPNLLQAVRKYKNILFKLTKCELDKNFLENCKVNDITPKFLRFKLYRKSLNLSNFYKSWQKNYWYMKLSPKKKIFFNFSHKSKTMELISIRLSPPWIGF